MHFGCTTSVLLRIARCSVSYNMELYELWVLYEAHEPIISLFRVSLKQLLLKSDGGGTAKPNSEGAKARGS